MAHLGSFVLAKSNGDVFTDAVEDDLLLYSTGARVLIGQSNEPAMLVIGSNYLFTSNITAYTIDVLSNLLITDVNANTFGGRDNTPLAFTTDVASACNVALASADVNSLNASNVNTSVVKHATEIDFIIDDTSRFKVLASGPAAAVMTVDTLRATALGIECGGEDVATFGNTEVTMHKRLEAGDIGTSNGKTVFTSGGTELAALTSGGMAIETLSASNATVPGSINVPSIEHASAVTVTTNSVDVATFDAVDGITTDVGVVARRVKAIEAIDLARLENSNGIDVYANDARIATFDSNGLSAPILIADTKLITNTIEANVLDIQSEGSNLMTLSNAGIHSRVEFFADRATVRTLGTDTVAWPTDSTKLEFVDLETNVLATLDSGGLTVPTLAATTATLNETKTAKVSNSNAILLTIGATDVARIDGSAGISTTALAASNATIEGVLTTATLSNSNAISMQIGGTEVGRFDDVDGISSAVGIKANVLSATDRVVAAIISNSNIVRVRANDTEIATFDVTGGISTAIGLSTASISDPSVVAFNIDGEESAKIDSTGIVTTKAVTAPTVFATDVAVATLHNSNVVSIHASNVEIATFRPDTGITTGVAVTTATIQNATGNLAAYASGTKVATFGPTALVAETELRAPLVIATSNLTAPTLWNSNAMQVKIADGVVATFNATDGLSVPNATVTNAFTVGKLENSNAIQVAVAGETVATFTETGVEIDAIRAVSTIYAKGGGQASIQMNTSNGRMEAVQGLDATDVLSTTVRTSTLSNSNAIAVMCGAVNAATFNSTDHLLLTKAKITDRLTTAILSNSNAINVRAGGNDDIVATFDAMDGISSLLGVVAPVIEATTHVLTDTIKTQTSALDVYVGNTKAGEFGADDGFIGNVRGDIATGKIESISGSGLSVYVGGTKTATFDTSIGIRSDLQVSGQTVAATDNVIAPRMTAANAGNGVDIFVGSTHVANFGTSLGISTDVGITTSSISIESNATLSKLIAPSSNVEVYVSGNKVGTFDASGMSTPQTLVGNVVQATTTMRVPKLTASDALNGFDVSVNSETVATFDSTGVKTTKTMTASNVNASLGMTTRRLTAFDANDGLDVYVGATKVATFDNSTGVVSDLQMSAASINAINNLIAPKLTATSANDGLDVYVGATKVATFDASTGITTDMQVDCGTLEASQSVQVPRINTTGGLDIYHGASRVARFDTSLGISSDFGMTLGNVTIQSNINLPKVTASGADLKFYVSGAANLIIDPSSGAVETPLDLKCDALFASSELRAAKAVSQNAPFQIYVGGEKACTFNSNSGGGIVTSNISVDTVTAQTITSSTVSASTLSVPIANVSSYLNVPQIRGDSVVIQTSDGISDICTFDTTGMQTTLDVQCSTLYSGSINTGSSALNISTNAIDIATFDTGGLDVLVGKIEAPEVHATQTLVAPTIASSTGTLRLATLSDQVRATVTTSGVSMQRLSANEIVPDDATSVTVTVGTNVMTVGTSGVTISGDMDIVGTLNAPNFAVVANYAFDSATMNSIACSSNITLGAAVINDTTPLHVTAQNGDGVSVYAAGSITALSTFNFSDERAKESIETIDPEHAKRVIRALKPSTYQFKTDKTKKQHMGVIAQELEKILPLSVETRSEYIPDLMMPAIVVEKYTDRIVLQLADDTPLHQKVRHIKFSVLDMVYYGTITEISNNLITVRTIVDGIHVSDPVMLLGSLVDDFRVVQYEPILMCLVSAVQSLL